MKYPVEKIKWIDSSGYHEQVWHPIKSHDYTISTITTVGQVIHEDKKTLTLALNISNNDSIMGDITIPKVAILKRKIIA